MFRFPPDPGLFYCLKPFLLKMKAVTLMNHKDLAQDILKHIGGSENVQNAIHCMTRLG